MTEQPEATLSPCAICRGKLEEHGPGKSAHAYTQKAGELVTHEEMAKRQAANQPRQAQIIRLPGGTQNEGGAINRLIEVLMDRDVLSPEEALYICGIGEKPRAPSGFQDPAQPPVSSGGVKGARDC